MRFGLVGLVLFVWVLGGLNLPIFLILLYNQTPLIPEKDIGNLLGPQIAFVSCAPNTHQNPKIGMDNMLQLVYELACQDNKKLCLNSGEIIKLSPA